MATTLIKNIKSLIQATKKPRFILRGKEMQDLPQIDNAYVLIEDGCIHAFGPMDQCPDRADDIMDATGQFVLPSWCDSHTHLVFAESREQEFVDKINGLSYQEISKKGGGILNSAEKMAHASEEQLFDGAMERLEEIMHMGTGAVEIKSGYGLSLESELKMLRVIRLIKERSPIPVKATFLGAHALPIDYKNNRKGFLDLIIDEMLPAISDEGLADYIDVFCEKIAFTAKETERLILAGNQFGLKAKIHTNQFYSLGGIEVCVKHNALSVDHLEVLNQSELTALQKGNTIATLLPSAPFFLNDVYPQARELINSNVPVALATDYNPGSSPSGNLPLAMSLACIKMKMTPEEAINAATINGAAAMELQDDYGSITPGKVANLIITNKMPSLAYLPYAFGSQHIDKVMVNGKKVKG